MKAFEDESRVLPKERETSNFAILLLRVFFCSGWSVEGVCGALAAEAIWISIASKVGQLVPVPLLMW